MTVNFVSSNNVTLSLHPFFSNSSNNSIPRKCYQYPSGAIIFPAFTLTNILILHPLHVLVLYVGLQRWRNQGSIRDFIKTSHIDLFAYHTVSMETLGIWALVLFSYGICTDSEKIIATSIYVFCMFFPGETMFDCLTCVERYLAVVHPIIYMKQKKQGAARIRNISIWYVWLQCFASVGVASSYYPYFPTIPFLFFLSFSLIIVCYCCLSILRILIRPGPGEVGRDREEFDKSKLKAFRITMIILGTLLLRFLGFFLCFGLLNLVSLSENVCVWMNSGIWLTIPSGLVLPLLFLQRAGKLPCCKQSTDLE